MAEKAKNYEVSSLGSFLPWKHESKQGSREVPMKVLCLGFPRTGTISLKKALERLGYGKCYHMSEWAIHPEHTDFWSRAVAAKYEDGPKISKKEWDSVLSSYQSGADIPFSEFTSELLEIYPNTKVILTNKSPDALWKSWSKAASFSQHPPWYLTALNCLLDPLSQSAESRRRGVMHRLLKNKFDGRPLDESTVKRVFQEHYDHVRSLVPKGRLLEYRIEEGWEPLCEFLGEEVPDDEEFPRGNSSEDFQNAVRLIWKIQTVINLGRGLLFVGGVWASWRYLVHAGFSCEWLKGVVNFYR